MKLYLLPLFLLPVLFTRTAFGQSITVTLPPDEITVGQSLEIIASQSGFRFSYSSRSLETERKVRFSLSKMAMEDALHHILSGSGHHYTIQGSYILIQKGEKEQTRPMVRKPVLPPILNGDRYVRTPMSVHDSVNRRRPIQAPMIHVADSTKVIEDTDRSDNSDEYTSHTIPLQSYFENRLPRFILKTNLLHGLGTLTPNIGIELGLGNNTSIELHGAINAWKLESDEKNNKKLAHIYVRPEFRYWSCERLNGHFFGLHGIFAHYNVGSHSIPGMFSRKYRYDGIAVGGGVTYGYHLLIDKRWGIEFNIGAGAIWMHYDRFACDGCERSAERRTRTYVGPTRAGISLTFNLK